MRRRRSVVSAIETWTEQDVRWISFARPDKLNALTVDELREVTSLLRDTRPRAAVFTGAGERAFSAGMHVDGFRGLDPHSAAALIREVRDFVAAARTAEFPTVCAVNGYCLGAAFELALACDVRVAAEHAVFGLPEIAVGIPSVIDAALLQQHVGLGKAKEMILTGRLYPVRQLPVLANDVVDPDELVPRTRSFVDDMARHSSVAMAAQKRLFETWQNSGLSDGADASIEEFAGVFAFEETADRVRARGAELGDG